MCASLIVSNDREPIDSVGELRKWAYPASVPFRDDVASKVAADGCLCNVDWSELGKRMGGTFEREGGYGDWFFTPAPTLVRVNTSGPWNCW